MKFLKASATVGFLTFLSRIVGFIRDILMAAVLGSGVLADIFFVALRFPNLFRAILAEGAFSVAFIPLYTSIDEKEGRKRALDYASKVFSVLSITLVLICALAMIAMPLLLFLIAPGFYDDPVKLAQAIELTRITFPYLFFMSLVAMIGGMLNAHDYYAPFAAAPILFNLSFIVTLIFFPDFAQTSAHSLSWTILIAGLLQLLFVMMFAFKYKLNLSFKLPRIDKDVKELLGKMGPAVVASGAAQISLLFNTILASFFPVGAVSYIYYSDRLAHLPIGIIGIAVGTALLPMLTRAVTSKDIQKGGQLFTQALFFALLLALPAAVALIVSGQSIISVLFERGEFTRLATIETGRILSAYAWGMPAIVIWVVYTRLFFAKKDTKTPMVISLKTTVYDVVFSVVLAYFYGVVGIAWGTSIAAWIRVLMFYLASRDLVYAKLTSGFIKRSTFLGASVILMALFLWGFETYVESYLYSGDLFQEIAALTGLVFGGMLVYAIGLSVTKAIRLSDLKRIAQIAE